MLVITGEEPTESLFMKELRRRGMTPTSLLEETNTNIKEEEQANSREEDGGVYRRNAVSTDSGRNLTNQREQSMSLNSEGLEVGRFPPYTLFEFWFKMFMYKNKVVQLVLDLIHYESLPPPYIYPILTWINNNISCCRFLTLCFEE